MLVFWWVYLRGVILRLLRYINTSVIAGNKPEVLNTILERYKQVYLAQEDESKDTKSYSTQ